MDIDLGKRCALREREAAKTVSIIRTPSALISQPLSAAKRNVSDASDATADSEGCVHGVEQNRSDTLSRSAAVGSNLEHKESHGQLRKIAVRSSDQHPRRRVVFSPRQLGVLRGWLLAHLQDAYPSEKEKELLAREAGLDVFQVNNWFINARRRMVPHLLKQQALHSANNQCDTENDGAALLSNLSASQHERQIRFSGKNYQPSARTSHLTGGGHHPYTYLSLPSPSQNNSWQKSFLQQQPLIGAGIPPHSSMSFLAPFAALQNGPSFTCATARVVPTHIQHSPAANRIPTPMSQHVLQLTLPCNTLPNTQAHSPFSPAPSPTAVLIPLYQPSLQANHAAVYSLPTGTVHSADHSLPTLPVHSPGHFLFPTTPSSVH